MFQLEPLNGHNGLDCPFVLELEGQDRGFSLQSLRSDMEICMDIAREASDWFLFLLKVGEITGAFASFRIVGRAALDRHTLRRAAEEMKQIQRAAKAPKLARGLTAIRKRKRRTQGKRKTSQRPLAASAAQDISDAEWASDSDSLTEDAEGADGSPSMPASLGEGSASAAIGPAVRRQGQPRAIPWGPFQIAPIIPASGQTGWGAICRQYCDRGNTLSCKKAPSRGSTLTDAVCILRVKKRLIAGCSDADWPIHRQRSHHVELGSKGLQDFAERVCRKRRWMHWWSHGVDPHVWLLRLEPRFATCSRLLRHSAHCIHAFISFYFHGAHVHTHSRAQNALEILKYLLTCLNNVSKRSSR